MYKQVIIPEAPAEQDELDARCARFRDEVAEAIPDEAIAQQELLLATHRALSPIFVKGEPMDWNLFQTIGPRPKELLKTDIQKKHESLRRLAAAAMFAYALPTETALQAVAVFVQTQDRVVSLYCGLALWEAFLARKLGRDVFSVDDLSWSATKTFPSFMNIHKCDAAVALQHTRCKDRNVLFVAWPPEDASMARILALFKGDKFVYVGPKESASVRYAMLFGFAVVEEMALSVWHDPWSPPPSFLILLQRRAPSGSSPA